MVSIGKHYRQKPLRFQTFQEGIEVLASLAEVFVKFISKGKNGVAYLGQIFRRVLQFLMECLCVGGRFSVPPRTGDDQQRSRILQLFHRHTFHVNHLCLMAELGQFCPCVLGQTLRIAGFRSVDNSDFHAF